LTIVEIAALIGFDPSVQHTMSAFNNGIIRAAGGTTIHQINP
jgi:hypothetical protein